MRLAFQRDEEIDLANRQALVAELSTGRDDHVEENSLNEDERRLVEVVAASVITRGDERKQDLELGGDHFVKSSRLHQGTNSRLTSLKDSKVIRESGHRTSLRKQRRILFEVKVSIDMDVEECLAWFLHKASRSRQISFSENEGGASRKEKVVGRSTETTDVFFVRGIGGDLDEKAVNAVSIWTIDNVSGSGRVVSETRADAGQQPTVFIETLFNEVHEGRFSIPTTSLAL